MKTKEVVIRVVLGLTGIVLSFGSGLLFERHDLRTEAVQAGHARWEHPDGQRTPEFVWCAAHEGEDL